MKKIVFIVLALVYMGTNDCTIYASTPAAAAAGAGAGKAVVEHVDKKISDEQAFAHVNKMYRDANFNQKEKKILLQLLDLSLVMHATNLVKLTTFKSDKIDQTRRSLRADIIALGKTIEPNAHVDQLLGKIQNYLPDLHARIPQEDVTVIMIQLLSFYEKFKKSVLNKISQPLRQVQPNLPAVPQ